jgi:serine/threonine protein kinase
MPPSDPDPEALDQGVAADPLVGRSIDKYDVLGVVGRGGMGAVYEALNTTINKRVAMKCIDTSLADNPEATARFQREAMAASAVESPHIVQIFDAGVTTEGTPYIVMELLRGRDLGKCIAELGKLELGDALQVVAQVLRGRGPPHAAGIIHRDLKPDNVFLVEREDEPTHVKILDFGVSKLASSKEVPLKTLTRQGTIVGTPYYMAPEQAQGFPDIDVRADIYSVGAILYECLAGRPPHVGQAYEQVIVAICMRDAEDVRQHNPSVPEPIARVIAKALSRERSERHATARCSTSCSSTRQPSSAASTGRFRAACTESRPAPRRERRYRSRPVACRARPIPCPWAVPGRGPTTGPFPPPSRVGSPTWCEPTPA